MTAPPSDVHSLRRLRAPYPEGWMLLLSHEPAERLIVFVHGFHGKALATWQCFPASAERGPWWQASDMLFMAYASAKDTITDGAKRLVAQLPRFYPVLPEDLTAVGQVQARPTGVQPYRELLLVGHSLGGVIVRRALVDTAQAWVDELKTAPDARRPPLLDAQVRLFSPASAGFRPAGWMGFLRATSLWSVVAMTLHGSPSFTDLQIGSRTLANIERRTELLAARGDDFAALRASILWASPDNVVLDERYDCDLMDDAIDDTTHISVCKPHDTYRLPWDFVQSGHRL